MPFHLDRRARDLRLANAAAGPPDELIDTHVLAAWLGISRQWLEIGRHKGYGPKFVKLGNQRVRYRRDAVRQWLIEREFQSTACYASGPPAPNPVRLLKVQLKPREQRGSQNPL